MNILNKFKLEDKKCIVTGSGQGIGRVLAHALAQAGADIAIVDINKETANSVVKEIISLGRKSFFIKADLTIPSEAKKMVNNVLSEWGRLDIAVNNAGTSHTIDAIDETENGWDNVINLNLKGAFFCAQAEAIAMIPNKYGKIINITSMSAYMISKYQYEASYSASKAGLLHLTRALAVEWISKGIRVNAISPGYMNTPMLEQALGEDSKTIIPRWIENTPINRLGQPEDLQGALIFLASEASDFMTGQDIILDGGYLLL